MNSSLEGKYVSLCLPCAVSVLPGAQKMYSFLKQKKANLMTKADLKKANSGIMAILKMVIHLYIYSKFKKVNLMSGHNQLLVNYTRQCRNLPSRLPAFCRNKVPQLHGKFYQETSSVEYRREHTWTQQRAKDSLKDDEDKNSDVNLMQAISGTSPYLLNLKNAAHR